jgi:hypothetical protein
MKKNLSNIKSHIGEDIKANKMNMLLAYAKEMDETLYKKGKRRKRTPEQLLSHIIELALKLGYTPSGSEIYTKGKYSHNMSPTVLALCVTRSNWQG